MKLKIELLLRPAHRFAGIGVVCLALAGCGGDNRTTPQIQWATPAPISYGTALSAAQLNATASAPGVFAYSPSLGTVPSAGSQTLSVTFTPADITLYAPATASVTLTVIPTATSVTWSAPAAIVYGTPLSAVQLNAVGSAPGTFAYTPTSGTILNAGAQKLSVTFTPTDTNFAISTASITLTVNPAAPVLNWNTPAATPYGTALSASQLNATASVPGNFAYTPSAGSQLTIGAHTLSATFTPADSNDYTPAAASVTLTVNQAKTIVTWTPKAWIAAGAPLGSGQLNAMATSSDGPVAGTFNYSPPAGTIFTSTGPQALTVTFTPADALDYTTPPVASVSMNVSSFGVVAWGDSLTSGDEGWSDTGNYPTDLDSLITLNVVNMGIRGQTSTQVAVREGGVSTYATVEGGLIPASGGVTVTFPTGFEPINADGPAKGVTGTVAGVHGTVTYNSTSAIFTFTRTNSGSAVSAPGTGTGAPALIVDRPYANYLPVIWVGRNNVSDPTQILSDIAAMVATIPAGQDYLVLSDINIARNNEWLGQSEYLQIIATNEKLAAIYGTHYLDIRKVLVNSYNPALVTDVTDFLHDVPPTSLRAMGVQTTLTNPVGATDTTITLASTANIGAEWILTLDPGTANAENVYISAVSGNTVTVVRNYGGVQTAHNAGALVQETDFVHFNAQGAQIEAEQIANYLTAYAK